MEILLVEYAHTGMEINSTLGMGVDEETEMATGNLLGYWDTLKPLGRDIWNSGCNAGTNR